MRVPRPGNPQSRATLSYWEEVERTISKRSSDLSCRSAAFSFESSPSHLAGQSKIWGKRRADASRVAEAECGQWLPQGCRPRTVEGPPILMADGPKETVGRNHARFRRGGSRTAPVPSRAPFERALREAPLQPSENLDPAPRFAAGAARLGLRQRELPPCARAEAITIPNGKPGKAAASLPHSKAPTALTGWGNTCLL